MDNLAAHSKEPLCTAYGSQVNHTKEKALSKGFFFENRQRLSYLSAALQDRRALPSCYVKNDVTTRIDSPCSGLSRPLAAAPSHTLQRHIPSCCFCFSPYRVGWTADAVFRELAVVDSPLRSALQKPCVCETQEAVMRGRTFGWYVRTPRSTRLLHLYDNNKHASNSYRYAKAPEATATGNWVLAGKIS